MDQAIVQWTGFPGAPGFSVFYALEGGAFADALQTFFNAVKAQLPSTVRIQVPNSGAQINPLNGEQTSEWSDAPRPAIIGGAGGKYSAASGCCFTWSTGTFVNGRRVRGRTFLVPLESGCYAPDGSLDDGTRTILAAAANALVTAGTDHFVIWHRPKPHGTDTGIAAKVTSVTLRDRVAILTSRRV